MEYLTFHTEELPQMADAGARYVVVACCGGWRDGEVTNSFSQIPRLQRELRKRFMNRITDSSAASCFKPTQAGQGKGVVGSS